MARIVTGAMPPPPPAAWKGTPAAYTAMMNAAGFTWNGRAWQWRPAGNNRDHPA